MFGRERADKDFSLRIFVKLAFTNKCFFFFDKTQLVLFKSG